MSAAPWHRGSWLARLPARVADSALDLGRQTIFLPDETLMRQGDAGRHVVLILSGVAKVVAGSSSGELAVLSVRFDGDLVGEMAATDGHPRSASVVTCSPLRARLIAQAEFSEFVAAHPSARDALAAMLADRLRWANRRRMDFVGYSPATRLTRVLLDLSELLEREGADAGPVEIRLTQADLASMAGISLATAERSLRLLQQQGLVTRRYRSLSVVDVRGLEAVSEVFE